MPKRLYFQNGRAESPFPIHSIPIEGSLVIATNHKQSQRRARTLSAKGAQINFSPYRGREIQNVPQAMQSSMGRAFSLVLPEKDREDTERLLNYATHVANDTVIIIGRRSVLLHIAQNFLDTNKSCALNEIRHFFDCFWIDTETYKIHILKTWEEDLNDSSFSH